MRYFILSSLFSIYLSTVVNAGLINPLETGFENSRKMHEKQTYLERDINDYSIWEWLYLTQSSPIETAQEARTYYFNQLFIDGTFDTIELTLQAGVFTGALTPSDKEKKYDYIQWLDHSSTIINYWQ